VKWGRHNCQPDCFQNAVDVFKDVVVPESNDTVTAIGQLSATQGIRALSFAMLTAIKLDSQLVYWTGKINYALADRMLAAKFPLWALIPQDAPKTPHNIGGIATKSTRN